MQKLLVDILWDYFSKDKDYILDMAEAAKLKKLLAREFKDQSTKGTPTKAGWRAGLYY